VWAVAAATYVGPSEPDQLRALERTRLHAVVAADTDTIRNLTATDFQLIDPTGEASSREEYVNATASGYLRYLVLEPITPVEVRLSGDSAALRYQASFDLVVGRSTHVAHQGWVTDLYEHRDGRWQITWEQATARPNNTDLFVRSIEPIT
jgi:hypothetical protein